MKTITPRTIDLISTDATETTAEWVSGTSTYVTGERVKRATTNMIYEALQDMDVEHGALLPEDCTDYWSEVCSVNDHAMFDMFTSTQTERTNSLTVTVTADKCDHFAVFNMSGVKTITWSLADTATSTVVDSGTINLSRRNLSGWYDFFFSDFEYREDIVQNIQIQMASQLTVTFNGATGESVYVGHMSVGRAMYLGATKLRRTGRVHRLFRDTTNDFGVTHLATGPGGQAHGSGFVR